MPDLKPGKAPPNRWKNFMIMLGEPQIVIGKHGSIFARQRLALLKAASKNNIPTGYSRVRRTIAAAQLIQNSPG